MEEELPNEYGIMIMDTEGITKDNNLRKKLFPMLRQGTYYSNLETLIEDPLFTDSKWRNMSQLVDCVAYCIRRKYRTAVSPSIYSPPWDHYFTQIESKFDSPAGNYRGYGLNFSIKSKRG